jgi:uncharacterized protein
MSEQEQNIEVVKKGYEAFMSGDMETVVVLSETTSGGETSQDADVFTLRDGKLVRAQVYGDTAIMERVFGKKQLAGSGTD